MNALSLDGDLRDEHAEYAQNVYVYHLVKAANALANASRNDAGGPRNNSVQDISVGFGLDVSRLNVYCKEAPGVVVYRATRMRKTSGFTTATSKIATGSAEIALAKWLHRYPR